MIYIVAGHTGEYSDHQEWNVRAFQSEQDAKALCDTLNEWCREKKVALDYKSSVSDDSRESCGHPPADPEFQCDYTGTEYAVVPVPM